MSIIQLVWLAGDRTHICKTKPIPQISYPYLQGGPIIFNAQAEIINVPELLALLQKRKKKNFILFSSLCLLSNNYFSKYYENTTFGYQLVDGKSIEEVISIFRSPLVDEVVESFTCEEVIENSIGKKDNYIGYEKAKVLKRIKDE